MWFNGLITLVDMALAGADPQLRAHRDAIVWGTLREDVWYVPIAGAVVANPSLSHFERPGWPGGFVPVLSPSAGARAATCARRALSRHAAGDDPGAFVNLGRAVHAVADMACPVHAQGRVHGADPFEWAVEAMSESLRELPLPAVKAEGDFAAITSAVAKCAQQVQAGGIDATEARRQALAIIPFAAAHIAGFFTLYANRAREAGALPERTAPIDRALEMPLAAQRRWCAQLVRWSDAHGGRRHYARLMDLAQARADALQGEVFA